MTESTGRLFLIPAPLSDSDPNLVVPEGVRLAVRGLRRFIVEDLRTARRYLSKLKLDAPVAELEFSLLNEHTDKTSVAALLVPALDGHDMGLLSDAGLPCIADPGEELVLEAHRRGVRVVPLTGPSSIFLALAASGLSGERFSFEGYLPAKRDELAKALKRLEQASRRDKQCKIFIEAPYRGAAMFDALLSTCAPETLLCVACNLTGDDEFIATRRIGEWKREGAALNKKPCIFIIQA
jgi:16S rRNA (cytidine1402-2'-O)-methyltransferase